MKAIIILICILISTGVNAQDKKTEEIEAFDKEMENEISEKSIKEEIKEAAVKVAKETKPDKESGDSKSTTDPLSVPRINNNYLGINLIYNGSTLIIPDDKNYINPNMDSSGYGFDMFYQSYLSEAFSYQVLFEFLYNSFINDGADEVYWPLNTPPSNPIYPEYNQIENFYNFIFGFTFRYYIYMDKLFGATGLKSLYPYFSTGLLSSSIYKTYYYKYKTSDADSWISSNPESKWLAASFTLPFSFGINYMLNAKNVINLSFTYMYILFNETSQNYGYNNIMNFKLGYMMSLNFKL